MYEQGKGVPQDIVKAFGLYTKAVKLSYSDGKADVERLQAKLSRKAVASKEAAIIKLRAREIDPHDCDLLAGSEENYLFFGEDQFKNLRPLKAIPACRDAVEAYPDIARFEFQLAHSLHVRGRNTEKEAASWYRKAAKNGHIKAMYNLARMYQYGTGNVEK